MVNFFLVFDKKLEEIEAIDFGAKVCLAWPTFFTLYDLSKKGSKDCPIFCI